MEKGNSVGEETPDVAYSELYCTLKPSLVLPGEVYPEPELSGLAVESIEAIPKRNEPERKDTPGESPAVISQGFEEQVPAEDAV